MKKNFDAIDRNMYADQAPQAPEETNTETAAALNRATLARHETVAADPEEKKIREASGKTQGRKGCALTRINMRFTSENYDYIKTMSAINGQSMREFVNACIEDHRKANADRYERAAAFRGEIEQ